MFGRHLVNRHHFLCLCAFDAHTHASQLLIVVGGCPPSVSQRHILCLSALSEMQYFGSVLVAKAHPMKGSTGLGA